MQSLNYFFGLVFFSPTYYFCYMCVLYSNLRRQIFLFSQLNTIKLNQLFFAPLLVLVLVCPKSLFRFIKKINHAKFRKRRDLIDVCNAILSNKLLQSLRRSAFFPKHLWLTDKILIEVIFFLSIKESMFFWRRGFLRKKQIVVGRSNVRIVGRVGQKVSNDCKEFVSDFQRYVLLGVVVRQRLVYLLIRRFFWLLLSSVRCVASAIFQS